MRGLARWEILSLVMTALVIEWVALPLAGRSSPLVFVPLAFCGGLLIASARLHGETRRDLGLRFDNFFAAVRLLVAPMVFGAVVVIALGWWLRSAGFGEAREGRLLLKVTLWGTAWGFVQQYALQAFVNRRAQTLFGRGSLSILLVASAFALLHAPNLWLMLVTFTSGALWAYVYQRAPNLFALALSHGIMSWLLVWSIPESLLQGMRAGYNYFL